VCKERSEGILVAVTILTQIEKCFCNCAIGRKIEHFNGKESENILVAIKPTYVAAPYGEAGKGLL
jgi:hypothetical protein